MTKKQIITANLTTAACFASFCGALYGQTTEKGNIAFQYFVNEDRGPGMAMVRFDGLGAKAAVGRPLSATEERHTLQVLGDGTRIEKKETDKYFRDAEGRTRIERDGGDTVMITDPVAGFSTEMNSANKTARKINVMRTVSRTSALPGQEGPMIEKLKAEMTAARPAMIGAATGVGAATAGSAGVFTAHMDTLALTKEMAEAKGVTPEDLGTQIVNGVPAQGNRSTITIPVGQIGNDKEILVVSERWFSTDLQMLVKSSNKDPRFGDTTYELTNIVQGAQDPTLFQVPADFTVNGGLRQ